MSRTRGRRGTAQKEKRRPEKRLPGTVELAFRLDERKDLLQGRENEEGGNSGAPHPLRGLGLKDKPGYDKTIAPCSRKLGRKGGEEAVR